MLQNILRDPLRAFVVDKDGTLARGTSAVQGARRFMETLRERGIPHVVMSNTGVKTAEEVARDLSGTLGVDIPPSRVCTAHDCMRDALEPDVVVVGEGDVTTASRVAIFTDGNVEEYTRVVSDVARCARRGGELWITSLDPFLVDAKGERIPGPGALVAAIEATLGQPLRRLRVFGKGGLADHAMTSRVNAMLREQGFRGNDHDVIIVGDRFDTDVRAGAQNGWSTCLVESGCHTLGDRRAFPTDVTDYVAENVGQLVEFTGGPLDTLRRVLRRTPMSSSIARRASDVLHTLAQRVDESLDQARMPRRIRSDTALSELAK